MSLIGFGVRRVLKAGANELIDNVVDDPETAKVLKIVTGIGITVVGIGLSIATADVVGVGDAVMDAGDTIVGAGEVVVDHGTDLAVDHSANMIDHVTSWHDSTDLHFGSYGTTPGGADIEYVDQPGYGYTDSDNYLHGTDKHSKGAYGQWD